MELERGATVHGTVRDATTRRPIAGVIVRPKAPHFNIYLGSEERETKSDWVGQYQLHGVNLELGISALHPENGSEGFGVDVQKGEGALFDVYVTPLDHCNLKGTVRDSSGQPLEGVTVSARGVTTSLEDVKHVQTARDGTYSLQGVLGLPDQHYIPPVTYTKDGYVTQQFVRTEVGKDALIILERQVALEGQVLGPDGQPVKSFAVCAGPDGASPVYLSVKSVERIITDTAGRFKLWLDQPGATWVGVRAQGCASWEGSTDIPRKGGSLVVRMESGVSVTGRIMAPPGAHAKLQARLVPRRGPSDDRDFRSSSEVIDWFSRNTTVATDGRFRFEHIRPDRYKLDLEGPSVTSRLLVFDVPATGLDLGEVRVAGRGRIQGRAFRSKERGGGVLQYADGRALQEHPSLGFVKREFTTDEDGQFSVGGLPVGIVYVGFPHFEGGDESSDDWVAQVCEDQTTEVRYFDPVGSRPLPVEFRVGDGYQHSVRVGDRPEHQTSGGNRPAMGAHAPLGADPSLRASACSLTPAGLSLTRSASSCLPMSVRAFTASG